MKESPLLAALVPPDVVTNAFQVPALAPRPVVAVIAVDVIVCNRVVQRPTGTWRRT